MAILANMKAAKTMKDGLSTVTLKAFGEIEPRKLVTDAGNTSEPRAALYLLLETENGATARHCYWYTPVPVYNEELQREEPGISEEDYMRFSAIWNAIKAQLPEDQAEKVEADESLVSQMQFIRDEKIPFEVLVETIPDPKGTGKYFTNYTYSLNQINSFKELQ